MIRKFYAFFLLFIVATTAAHAQRTADFTFQARMIGSSFTNKHPIAQYEPITLDGQTKHYMHWSLKNLGNDTLYANDSVHFKFAWGWIGNVVVPVNVPKDSIITIYPVSGQNIGYAVFPIPPNVNLPYIDTVLWCDSFWISAGPGKTPISDPNMSNNYICNSVVRSAMWAVSVNDIALNENDLTIYPNPATESVTIKFDARTTGSATITLCDMMGKTVYNRSLNDLSGTLTHSVDVGHLPPGMYTAELRHDNQTLIRKLTIQ